MLTFLPLFVVLCAGAGVRAANPYFPKGSVSDFEQTWYAKHLLAMKEPILSLTGKDRTYFAFRVLYLPTWGRPVAVRYEKKGDRFVRRSVKLSGDGGYDPGKIADQKETQIERKEVDDLATSLEKAGFWDMPVNDNVMGVDGSQLIIEVIKDGHHRVRVRWTPEHQTEKRGLAGLVNLYTAQFQTAGFWTKR